MIVDPLIGRPVGTPRISSCAVRGVAFGKWVDGFHVRKATPVLGHSGSLGTSSYGLGPWREWRPAVRAAVLVFARAGEPPP